MIVNAVSRANTAGATAAAVPIVPPRTAAFATLLRVAASPAMLAVVPSITPPRGTRRAARRVAHCGAARHGAVCRTVRHAARGAHRATRHAATRGARGAVRHVARCTRRGASVAHETRAFSVATAAPCRSGA